MAIGIHYLEYLADQRVLASGCKVLDIGTQNLYNASRAEMETFIQRFPKPGVDLSVLDELAHRSIVPHPLPDISTTFVSELFDLTTIRYNSFDVAPGRKTHIFDLNRDNLSKADTNHYDVVFNFGTTEHIFDQVNSFRVIHHAAKPMGYIFHQVPSTGCLDHCYFVYNRRFFVELAEANQYELVDLWYTGPKVARTLYDVHPDLEIPDSGRREVSIEKWKQYPVPSSVINVLYRKKHDDRFRLPLEVSTTHDKVDERIDDAYRPSAMEREPREKSFFGRLFKK